MPSNKTEYTCPMHPEIIRDATGSCPICGMDLVPIIPSLTDDENKTYKVLLKKFRVSKLFHRLRAVRAFVDKACLPGVVSSYLGFDLRHYEEKNDRYI